MTRLPIRVVVYPCVQRAPKTTEDAGEEDADREKSVCVLFRAMPWSMAIPRRRGSASSPSVWSVIATSESAHLRPIGPRKASRRLRALAVQAAPEIVLAIIEREIGLRFRLRAS